MPTGRPTGQPSGQPSVQPSSKPTGKPSSKPSGQPTRKPSGHPSSKPTGRPSAEPEEETHITEDSTGVKFLIGGGICLFPVGLYFAERKRKSARIDNLHRTRTDAEDAQEEGPEAVNRAAELRNTHDNNMLQTVAIEDAGRDGEKMSRENSSSDSRRPMKGGKVNDQVSLEGDDMTADDDDTKVEDESVHFETKMLEILRDMTADGDVTTRAHTDDDNAEARAMSMKTPAAADASTATDDGDMTADDDDSTWADDASGAHRKATFGAIPSDNSNVTTESAAADEHNASQDQTVFCVLQW